MAARREPDVPDARNVRRRRINRYVCHKCLAEFVTVEPGIGRVPYELKCQTVVSVAGIVPRSCGGFARSQFYDVPPDALPEWEFYSPQVSDLHSWFDRWRYTNNQLFIRRIDSK